MNILVTGGCDFIASNFIRYILNRRSDARVINLDSLTYSGNLGNLEDVEAHHGTTWYFFIHGDICDKALVESIFDGSLPSANGPLEGEAPDIVVNFAAETHVDRSINDASDSIRTNILGTGVLLSVFHSHWAQSVNFQNAGEDKGQGRLFLQVSTDEVQVGSGVQISGSVFRGPVIIGPGATIKDSFIGASASLGAGCVVTSSEVSCSIIMDGAQVLNLPVAIDWSLIGRDAGVHRGNARPRALNLVLGDASNVGLV